MQLFVVFLGLQMCVYVPYAAYISANIADAGALRLTHQFVYNVAGWKELTFHHYLQYV
jgi:hypothetical protein